MNHEIAAELVGCVIAVDVRAGDRVRAGDTVMLMESMKMEIPVLTRRDGIVNEVAVAVGDVVRDGQVMLVVASTE